MYKVLVLGNIREEGLNLLREFSNVTILPEPAAKEDIRREIADADAVLHKMAPLSRDVVEHQTRLKIIARHGVGLDDLDLPYIGSLRIPVSTTTTANSNAVAECAVGLMLSSLRRFSSGERMIKVDRRWHREQLMGRELGSVVVGLVGYGRIGSRVGKMLKAFGTRVLVHDLIPGIAAEEGYVQVSLPELLREADIVSLHCPLSAETRNLIDASAIAQMKQNAILVNTARGGLVDKEALADALESRHLAGAAMDSFDREPPNFDDRLFRQPEALVIPHVAAMTISAQIAMAVGAASEIRRVLVDGLPPSNNVAPCGDKG